MPARRCFVTLFSSFHATAQRLRVFFAGGCGELCHAMKDSHGLAHGDKEDDKWKAKEATEFYRLGQQQMRKAQIAAPADQVAEYEAAIQLFNKAIAVRPTHPPYFLSRGKCCAAIQQYHRAQMDFSMCVRYEPNAKHYGLRGQCLRRLQRLQDALRDYDEALRLESQKAEWHFERALVYMDLEVYDKAIDGFWQALHRNFQDKFKPHYHRGICFRSIGQLDLSIEELNKAIAEDPSSPEAHSHLGLSHSKVGNYEEAKQAFSNAIEFDQCADYLNNRGLACYHLAQHQEAIEDFTAALETGCDNAAIHYNRGNARYQLGQYREALTDFQAAISLDPDNPDYLHHKGLAYEGCGEVHAAISYYEEALRRDPGHHPSRFHAGRMYHVDGQYERALEHFNGGVPPDEALHEARGLVYRDMGDYNKALADFDKVIEIEPTKGQHSYNRGVVFHRMGREQDAIEDLSRAIEFGKIDAPVFNERGLAWRALGNTAQAVADHTAAIESDGLKTEYLSNRAQCLFEQGLYDRAEADLSRALQLDSDDAELFYKRGITRYAQRKYAEAIADLKSALRLDPSNSHLADIFYHLGVSYANLGKHNLAVPAYDQAVQRGGPERPHYLHERAKSLQVIGEHDRALRDFSRVIDAQPTNARAMFRRAFSFKACGKFEEAAEDFEAAKEFAPDDPRLVVCYRKVFSVACVSLGPAGHEDPHPTAIPDIAG